MNLAQLIGEQNLRIAQLEEALAARGGAVPAPAAASEPARPAPGSVPDVPPSVVRALRRQPVRVQVLDFIARSTCWLRAHDLLDALPKTNPASIYNALSLLSVEGKIARRGQLGSYEFASLALAQQSPDSPQSVCAPGNLPCGSARSGVRS